MNWQENDSLKQIKKDRITTEKIGITTPETEAKTSQYIVAVGIARRENSYPNPWE